MISRLWMVRTRASGIFLASYLIAYYFPLSAVNGMHADTGIIMFIKQLQSLSETSDKEESYYKRLDKWIYALPIQNKPSIGTQQ